MSFTVKYIGRDFKYWERLKLRYTENYPELNPHFLLEDMSDNYAPHLGFIQIYRECPKVVYIDTTYNAKAAYALMKLLAKNNVTRRVSVVSLHGVNESKEELIQSILTGTRICHIKSKEMVDVVYDPIALQDVNLAHKKRFFRAIYLPKAQMLQRLRVGFLAKNRMRVETFSPLAVNTFVDVNSHPLEEAMPSKRFFIKNESDKNLYYNTRYSYDLFYTFVDNDYFRATEKSVLKHYEVIPTKKQDEAIVADDLSKRKEKTLKIRDKINKWLDSRKKLISPKELKVLVLDESLEIFKQRSVYKEEINFSLNVQTHLMQNNYQLFRTSPHLIVINYDEKFNNKEAILSLLKSVKELKGSTPYILIFNLKDNKIDFKNNENILVYTSQIDFDVIVKMANKLKSHFFKKETEEKVFMATQGDNNTVVLKHNIEILSLTESIIYFKAKIDIPMWSVFEFEYPAPMLVTVVPYKDSTQDFLGRHCYRALIHGMGEQEKAMLRRQINTRFKST